MVRILTEDVVARNKLLMPLRRIKKRYEIQVCLDVGLENWVDLVEVSEKYNKIMKRHNRALTQDPEAKMSDKDEEFIIDYECFCNSLDLFAETSLQRNKTNQQKLQTIFESKLLICIFKDQRMNFKIRSKALKLYLEACLDIDPFQRLQVPSGQAVLKELKELPVQGNELLHAVQDPEFNFEIKVSRVRVPPRILELKDFL